MDDSIVNVCSVIISAVAAITTIAAVFVALWQTKWPYRIKLQIKARIVDSRYQTDLDKYFKEKRLYIEVNNTGFTDSSILCWGIGVNKRQRIDIQYYGDRVRVLKGKTMMRNSIPLVLFQDPVRSSFSKFSKRNKKLYLYFCDISGKTFYRKLDITTKRLIEMSNSDFKCHISEDEYEDSYLKYIDFGPLEDYLREHDFKNGK